MIFVCRITIATATATTTITAITKETLKRTRQFECVSKFNLNLII